MNKKTALLRKMGEKMASASVVATCFPLLTYQPKPPAKILAQMKASK